MTLIRIVKREAKLYKDDVDDECVYVDPDVGVDVFIPTLRGRGRGTPRSQDQHTTTEEQHAG